MKKKKKLDAEKLKGMTIIGDPEITGKHGTDIQDGKCSWLIVVALQRANREQRQILKVLL